MADTYPDYPALPQEWLVHGGAQPDYLEIPGIRLPEVNLGYALSNAHVDRGNGDATAIIHHEADGALSFADLADQSDRLAHALIGLGIEPGMRVGIRTPNRPEGIISAIAVWKLGAIVVPIPQLARASELDFYLRDTVPTAIIACAACDDIEMVADRVAEAGLTTFITFGTLETLSTAISWEDAIAAASAGPVDREVNLDSVAIVWHTGGTTGVPKGCYHTHRRFLLAGYSYGLATGSGPGQRWAAAAPIGHALGMIFHTIFTLLHGTTIVMVERFTDPNQLLGALAVREVTTFAAITASWARMHDILKEGNAPEPTSLRRGYAMWQSSSSNEVVEGWKQRGITLLNNFGSTAFANWVLIPQNDEELQQGSLGRAAPGYEIRVVDPVDGSGVVPGEIGRMLVRGASGLTYWRRPKNQAADVRNGWIYVDDLIVDQGDGKFGYMGRTDFLISSAGNKIAPSEVELVLGRHPRVKEVAVVGVPDPIRQECVAALVVCNDGELGNDELRKELQDMVKRELSPYKYPRVLLFAKALPRDHVDKVQTKLVRERLEEMLGAKL